MQPTKSLIIVPLREGPPRNRGLERWFWFSRPYPAKAARAHKERAEKETKARTAAKKLDKDGDAVAASKEWCSIVHRDTLRAMLACRFV